MRRLLLTLTFVLTLAPGVLAEEIVLTTGEVLHGDVVSRTDAAVVLDHPVLGRITIPASGIAASGAPGGAEPPASPAPPTPAPAPPESPWTWSAELGASGSDGNSDTSDLHTAIKGVLDDDARTLKLGAGYSRSESDGETTKDEAYVEVTHDWKLRDSRWFPFATARMEWDDFQDYDRRLSVGAGMGYQAVKTKTTDLKLRAGVIGTREWGSADESWRPEGLLGAELAWKISDAQKLEAATTAYPDLEESGEYRVVSNVAWSIRLDNAENLRLKLGVEHEVDSHRESPFEKVDVRWFAAVLYEF